MKKLPAVTFEVKERPPRKGRNKSGWGKKYEADKILELRKKALEARKKVKLKDCFSCPVRLELNVFSKNITKIKDAHNYVGDLDAFVAGVCEALQPAPKLAKISDIFNDHKTVAPNLPILFLDDSQVVEIIANKEPSDNDTSYTLKVEPLEEKS